MKHRAHRLFRKSSLVAAIVTASLVPYAHSMPRPQEVAPASIQPADSSQENLADLSLTGSHLHANPPLAGETVQGVTYTRELLRVQWRSNDPIDLYIIRPVGIAKPPVTLFLYSYPSDSDRFREDQLCANLVRNGSAAIGFASALTGHRYHDRPMSEWFVSDLHDSLVMSVHDVQMILNYLETRSDLDTTRVGFFGQGSGAAIAILTASVDPRIHALDLMDPWGGWPQWIAHSPQIPENERPRYQDPEFLATIAPLDPLQFIPRLSNRSIRIQQNLFNLAIPPAVQQSFAALVSPKVELVQYHDTHEYTEKVSTNARMLDWLHTRLAATP
jgi:hypothetical protein